MNYNGSKMNFTGVYKYTSETVIKFDNFTGQINITNWNITQLAVMDYRNDKWVQNHIKNHNKYFKGTPV